MKNRFKKRLKRQEYQMPKIELNPMIYDSKTLDPVLFRESATFKKASDDNISEEEYLSLLKKNFTENLEKKLEKYIKLEKDEINRRYNLSLRLFIPKDFKY